MTSFYLEVRLNLKNLQLDANLSSLSLIRLFSISLCLSLYISAALSISHLPPPLATTHQQHLLQLDGNVLQALLSLLSSVMVVIQKFLEYVLMLNNRYVNLYNAQYLGYLSLAPCYASINIGNFFENFVWKLDIYIQNMFFFF